MSELFDQRNVGRVSPILLPEPLSADDGLSSDIGGSLDPLPSGAKLPSH